MKTLATLIEQKLPNSRFDRFFLETFSKKLKKTEQIEEIIEQLKNFEPNSALEMFESLVNTIEKESEQERDMLRRGYQQKRSEEQKKI